MRSATESETALDIYTQRGRECAYGNLRMIARVVGSIYEHALRPVDLRAGQLALMWAILAKEPVEMSRLGTVTHTDKTTLSRTVEKLRKAGLVSVRVGSDGRRKLLSLSPLGRERFAAAMPYWEAAQQRAAEFVPLAEIRALARKVRKAAERAR
jgi:DNA-binding MarR family transcriptional regulator